MKKSSFDRLLKAPDRSFFLFGPRGTGKSTWLKKVLPNAYRVDLLDTGTALDLARAPGRLEGMVLGELTNRPSPWVILDEVQKIPPLLDEVHRLMENRGWRFALCGSSARKLKRGGADLLGGRAVHRSMEGLSAAELKKDFDLSTALEWGTLPLVVQDPTAAADILNTYINTYIREEVREEGLIRSLSPFLRFLEVAGALNGQIVNMSNVATEAQVPRASVTQYFSILVDTLLGHFLPTYQPGIKIRERVHPKFYWFDPGVARGAAGGLRDPVDGLWKGRALETLVFHELRVYNETREKHRPLAYYRTPAGVEIDFIIETRKRSSDHPAHVVCLEVKSAARWKSADHAALSDMKRQTGLIVDKAIGVYLGEQSLRLDGVDVWPVSRFFRELHEGSVF